MTKQTQRRYGIVKAQSTPELVDLVYAPHKEKTFVFGIIDVGRHGKDPRERLNKTYWNSLYLPDMRFRIATSSEVFSLLAYPNMKDYLKKMYSRNSYRVCSSTQGEDGIYLNIDSTLKGKGFDLTVDQKILQGLRDRAKPINSGKNTIWLGENDFAFVPYETYSFNRTHHDVEQFAKEGLARALEHTRADVAKIVKAVAKRYGKTIDADRFNPGNARRNWFKPEIVACSFGRGLLYLTQWGCSSYFFGVAIDENGRDLK
jgi:hypothetical protein